MKAYAFFEGPSDQELFRRQIPKIRSAVKTPNSVSTTLSRDLYNIRDRAIARVARAAEDAGMNYTMVVDGRDASDDAVALLNQAYNSDLYREGSEFRGEVVTRRGHLLVYHD